MRVTEPETNELAKSSSWVIAIGVLMIVLGIIAITFPFFATITSTLIFGWVFIFAGITQIVYAFRSHGVGHVAWKLILGVLYLLSGLFVVANPLQGALAFTLVLGITIFVQGAIQVAVALQMRSSHNWGWMLISGIAGIILGIFIWSNWPFTAAWIIGLWIGINLFSDGIWMLTLRSARQPTLP